MVAQGLIYMSMCVVHNTCGDSNWNKLLLSSILFVSLGLELEHQWLSSSWQFFVWSWCSVFALLSWGGMKWGSGGKVYLQEQWGGLFLVRQLSFSSKVQALWKTRGKGKNSFIVRCMCSISLPLFIFVSGKVTLAAFWTWFMVSCLLLWLGIDLVHVFSTFCLESCCIIW